MKRRDRLLAITLALQARPETAQSLADKFEVSKRTILRDMQSLSEIGVPLYAESGKAGGYRLMEGYRLPPLHLDQREALALLLCLKLMHGYADTPFNRERWTVQDKLLATLAPETAASVQRLLSFLEMEVPPRDYETPLLEPLLAFITASDWVQGIYRSLSGEKHVMLRPFKIYGAHGFWYCDAYSHTHAENRRFRVDRFTSLQRSLPPNEKKKPLADKNNQDPLTMIHARLTYSGSLQVERDYHIGGHVKQLNEDTWELRFHCPASEWSWAVGLFYSLGDNALVLEPAVLKQDIALKAREVWEKYQCTTIDHSTDEEK